MVIDPEADQQNDGKWQKQDCVKAGLRSYGLDSTEATRLTQDRKKWKSFVEQKPSVFGISFFRREFVTIILLGFNGFAVGLV